MATADTFEEDNSNDSPVKIRRLHINSLRDIIDYQHQRIFSFRTYNNTPEYSFLSNDDLVIQFGPDFSLKDTDLNIHAKRAKIIFHSEGGNTTFDNCNINITAYKVKFADGIGIYNSTVSIATEKLKEEKKRSDFVNIGKIKFFSDRDIKNYPEGHILKIDSTDIKFGAGSKITVGNFMLGLNNTHSTKIEFGSGTEINVGKYSSRISNTYYDGNHPVKCSYQDVNTVNHDKLPEPESEITMEKRRSMIQNAIDTIKAWFK